MIDFAAQMMMLTTLGYLSAVIEIYLFKYFGFDEKTAGLLFSIYTIWYFLTSLFEPVVSSYMKNEAKIIFTGIAFTSFSFLMLSQVVYNHYLMALFGLALMGIGDALMISKRYLVPTIARVLKTARIHYKITKSDQLVDTVSSLTLFFSNSGEIVGPVLGAFLVDWIGYNEGFFVMTFAMGGFLGFYGWYNSVFFDDGWEIEDRFCDNDWGQDMINDRDSNSIELSETKRYDKKLTG